MGEESGDENWPHLVRRMPKEQGKKTFKCPKGQKNFQKDKESLKCPKIPKGHENLTVQKGKKTQNAKRQENLTVQKGEESSKCIKGKKT